MKRGDKFDYKGSVAKVMTVADGYVMARLPRCMPFVIYEKDIIKTITPQTHKEGK